MYILMKVIFLFVYTRASTFSPLKVVQDAILSSIVKFQHTFFYCEYTYKAKCYVLVSTTKTTLVFFSKEFCVLITVQKLINIEDDSSKKHNTNSSSKRKGLNLQKKKSRLNFRIKKKKSPQKNPNLSKNHTVQSVLSVLSLNLF